MGNKLGITIIAPPKGNKQYLTVYGGLRTLSPIKVEKIVLSIKGEKLTSWDWKPHIVTGDEPRYMDFYRPEWLRSGDYSARLIAYTPDGYSKSEKFTLEVKD